MADQFEAPHDRGEDDIPRDRWGRYLLPHPETGKRQAWTRATTFAKSISDTFALSQWSQRMVAKGLTLRPDLVAMAHSLDVKVDKDKLNGLCEDAKAAAGNKVAANLGTALHSFSESVDRGMDVDSVPEPHRDDIRAYKAAMDAAGVRVVPTMIERQTAVPAFEIAGTFDRLLDLSHCERWFLNALGGGAPGTEFLTDAPEVVGDVKSGQDLQYGWNEIAIQLLTYAMGVCTAGVWNKQTQSWESPRPVRLDFAIVMHLPVGQKTCTLYKLDLTEAARAMELCRDVRRWRKLRVLATPLERVVTEPAGHEHLPMDEPHPPEVTGLSWLDRFNLAGSRGELSALFKEAVSAGVWSDALKDAGVKRLAVLEEKAG
jgi:hypothetical protein